MNIFSCYHRVPNLQKPQPNRQGNILVAKMLPTTAAFHLGNLCVSNTFS